MTFSPPGWLVVGWIGLWIAASIIYRRVHGKPILFTNVRGAAYLERTASGSCDDTWWQRIGGARNCLVVALTARGVIVRPFTPFNLMFLPEIYGLEFEAPFNAITRVQCDRVLLRDRVHLTIRSDNGHEHRYSLFLKDTSAFLALLEERGIRTGAT